MSRVGLPVTPSAVLALLVVALTSLGPLSTDFYLPALPAIARALHTDSAGVQLTLSIYLLGFGAGQLLVGPLSDRFGRRPVMLWGMLVFLLSSAVCVLADSLAILVAARLAQAFGACVGPVLGRAVVRDLYGPAESARMLSHVSTATALAPLLAPLFGGWLTAAWGWRATFVALALYAGVLVLAVWWWLKETNRHPDADALRPRRMLANYRALLADPAYRSALLIGCGAFAALFAFISGSPFVFIEHFGMSPQQMGLAFGLNVTGFMIGSTLSGRLSRRLGPARLIHRGVWLGALCGVVLALLALTGPNHAVAVMLPMWGVSTAIGLILPNATALGLAGYPKMAGAAASLMGFVQMGLGAGAGMLVGHGVQHGTAALGLTVAAGMLFSLAAWCLGPLGRRARPSA
ncbi:multidrug effflux MFS transporter [Thauera sp.]|jgi:DHA1 family bicyclomycin/chloramphenicol resistance-like MFS transporter|uniref:multidrug effflux MFS transporter n=1 Tax=Thauera sp. TaxID=1905334 RepID=UPI00262EF3D8|nr:multidrug effflux MFS transporter [Thauera sp.]MCK6408371.1 multidrug effflux MFS transporter [Thauera sp.]